MSATAAPPALGTPGPNVLRVYALEARYELLRALRQPSFAIPTLLFPVMFYVFFGLLFGRNGGTLHLPTYLLATYGTFGIMGPALFGFGLGVAIERGLGWLQLKRATPMPALAYFAAKLAMCMLFAAVVVVLLFTLGALFGGVVLARSQWLRLAGVLVAGAVPFCAMGLAIGSWIGPQAGPGLVNLIYLPMSFLSGLWIPIAAFPQALQKLAVALPAYHLSQRALATVGMSQGRSPAVHTAVLALFTAAFLAVALLGYRRATDRA